jgi:hypothetical protein
MFNGRPWTPDDTKALLQQVSSRKKVEEIARLQKRTVTSVESKLKSIAANLYFNEQLPYEEVEEKTGIKKDALLVRRIAASASGSPKLEVAMAKPLATHIPEPEPVAMGSTEPVSTPEPKPIPEPIQVITTESPFTLERLSTLLISSIPCLLTTS